jgi:hypothetical protein
MKKLWVSGFILCGVIPLIIWASSGDQDYLHSHIQYEFITPTGNNAPVVHPLLGKKTVKYKDKRYIDGEIELIERTSQIVQYKCSNCHDKNLPKSKKSPHSRIQIKHGNAPLNNCFVCHDKSNRDKLKSFSENNISFNEAAKLCYQCHSTQYKDWIKGSHGKRVGNWTGRRVIYNCTQCHNPHDPGFKKRQPLALPKMRGVN